MHPSTPLVEELENVPKEHGKNVAATSQFSSCIILNPVAKRAEVRCAFIWGLITRIASAGEITGFLRENRTFSRDFIKF